jgi:hypothetical protein
LQVTRVWSLQRLGTFWFALPISKDGHWTKNEVAEVWNIDLGEHQSPQYCGCHLDSCTLPGLR